MPAERWDEVAVAERRYEEVVASDLVEAEVGVLVEEEDLESVVAMVVVV